MSAYHDGRNTFYVGEFDEEMEQSLIIPLTASIRQQSELRDGRVDLWINSYGGNAHLLMHVLELVELAKNNDVVVRTIVTGAAYSAGSMLAIAGTEGERYISKDAMHLVHYGSTGTMNDSTPLQASRNHEANQIMFKQVLAHYNRFSNLPDLANNILDDNWFITAAKAKKWGMADKFTDKLELLW